MTAQRKWIGAALAVLGAVSGSARGGRGVDSRVVISQALPALEGGHLQAKLVEVTYAPGASSLPHSHPCAVIVYVVDGAIRSQVEGQPEAVYHAGESFYEAPNQLHLVSANASADKPATFIACFLCDRPGELSIPAPVAVSGAK